MLGHELSELTHHARVGRPGRPTALELRDHCADALVVEQRANEQLARFVAGMRERWEQNLLLLSEVRDCLPREEAQELCDCSAALAVLGLRGLPEPSRCDKRVVMIVRERNE
jgi:hypothetical protein